MSEQFELDRLIKEYLEEHCDSMGRLPDEARQGFLLQVARMVQYDVTFEKGLLEKTIKEIERKYPNIKVWDSVHIGTLPDIDATSKDRDKLEKAFDAQIDELEKNFSHARVDWLKNAGIKLYGSKSKTVQAGPKTEVGEPQGQRRTTNQSPNPISRTRQQEENSKRNYRETTNQTSHISGSKIAIAIVILLAIVMLFLKD